MNTHEVPKTKPVHQIRLGLVKAAIWAHQTAYGERHTVIVSRVYRDGNDWKHTHAFDRDHLLPLAEVLHWALQWIAEHEQQEGVPIDVGTQAGKPPCKPA